MSLLIHFTPESKLLEERVVISLDGRLIVVSAQLGQRALKAADFAALQRPRHRIAGFRDTES